MEEAPCVLHLSCAYAAVILTVLLVVFICGIGVRHPLPHCDRNMQKFSLEGIMRERLLGG